MVTINLTPRNLLPRHPWTSKLSHCSGGSCLANCWKASLAGRPRTTDPLRVSPVAKFMWRKCGKTRGKYMVKMIYIYMKYEYMKYIYINMKYIWNNINAKKKSDFFQRNGRSTWWKCQRRMRRKKAIEAMIMMTYPAKIGDSTCPGNCRANHNTSRDGEELLLYWQGIHECQRGSAKQFAVWNLPDNSC